MNKIGLEQEKVAALTAKLNDLLANYQVFYMNVRGFHWNIKGQKFFELHVKFEEMYNDLLLKVDEIAERVLTLGQTPVHTYTDYVQVSEIQQVKNVSSGHDSVASVLQSFEVLLRKQRQVLSLSADANDEGTNALMSDYIREQEKLVWMYSAFMAG